MLSKIIIVIFIIICLVICHILLFNNKLFIDKNNININDIVENINSDINYSNINQHNINEYNINQHNVWTYWENIGSNKLPTYIELCFDTMHKHLGKYNLHILDNLTIKNYLPDLRTDFNNLLVAQKVDYYRIALLEKYGGIWIDADIIVMTDFDDIFNKIDIYDMVGFGCTGIKCTNGYSKPSNWCIGSRAKGRLITSVLNKLNIKLNNQYLNNTNIGYHDYGKTILWESINELMTNNYKYYHYSPEYDGTRDIHNNWIHTPNYFSKYPTEMYLNSSKQFFMVLYNSEIVSTPTLKWILNCSKNELLYSQYWISDLYKKSLNIN